MQKAFEVISLKKINDPSFIMSPLELKDYIDFDVKRIYYITQPKSDSGQHSHYIEKELFIMIQGSCIAIIDRGNGKEDVPMQGPTTAIYVPNYVWHGFKDFSPDGILLALSSTNYNPDRSDYMEDYSAYLKIRDQKLSLT